MKSHRTGAMIFAVIVPLTGSCGDVQATRDAAGDSSDSPPCTLSPTAPDLVLEPAADNPASCRTPVPCELWFGHGQHLRCPRYLGPPAPIDVACNFGFGDGQCTCDDGMGFVADFAHADVVHSRDGTTCRYHVVPE